MHPWTMFFYGVRASSKPSVAPPKRAMVADPLELLPSQMALSLDRTVFYDSLTQLRCHVLHITVIERQFMCNLFIRHIQSHEIETQHPDFQRLMMASKNSVGQIIKALVTVVTLIALPGGFRVIKATLDDLCRLTRGARNAVWPSQLADGLITLPLIDQLLDIDLHHWTPVRGWKMGCQQYTTASNSTTLESNKSDKILSVMRGGIYAKEGCKVSCRSVCLPLRPSLQGILGQGAAHRAYSSLPKPCLSFADRLKSSDENQGVFRDLLQGCIVLILSDVKTS